MGISNTIPPSRLIQPGVVANTAARPTSPFTGQTIYQVDTNQMLIWNGTAWVIPNAPAQNPTGLELIFSGALSTATTKFQTCFSSTYRNYRVVIDSLSVSAATWVYINYLSGATANSATEYSSGGYGFSSNANGVTRNAASSTTGYLSYYDTAGLTTSMQFDISGPMISQRTYLQGTAISYQSAFAWSSPHFFVEQNQTTTFDGFQIATLGAPTLTGNVAIYGYRI